MVRPSRVVFLLLCLVINGEEIQQNSIGKVIIDNDAGGDDAAAIFLALLNEKYNNGFTISQALLRFFSSIVPPKSVNKVVSAKTPWDTENTGLLQKALISITIMPRDFKFGMQINRPNVIGLTTVKGNTIESNVNINNQRILKVAKRQDIPIYRGAKDSLLKEFESGSYYGGDGLGDSDEEVTDMVPAHEENAVSALIELSKTHAGELSVLCLGPLTNIAIALRLDPEFIGRLAHLYIGAGHIQSDDFHSPEFNAQFDIEAYHIVLQNANPDKVTLLPFSQVQIHLNYSKNWRQEVLGGINNDIVKAMNKYERVTLNKNKRWMELDPAVVAAAVKPDLVKEYKYSKNDIISNGDKRGIVSNKFVDKEKANARVIFSMKTEDYSNFLLSVFSAEK